MAIKVQPKSGPINFFLFNSTIMSGAAWATWPGAGDAWQWGVISFYLGCGGLGSGIVGARQLRKDYKTRSDIKESEKVSADFGDAREATWDEIVARGMTDPNSGPLAGFKVGKPIFFPPDAIFAASEIPPGEGKSSKQVIGSVIHQAMMGKSILVPDVKAELAVSLIPFLKKQGISYLCINPTKQNFDICGDTPVGLYQSIIDAVNADDDTRLDVTQLAYDKANLHLPDKAGKSTNDQNFFSGGSRRSIAIAILLLALTDPGNCTPSGVFELLTHAGDFIEKLTDFRDHFEGLIKDDPLVDFIKLEAENLLRHAREAGDNHYFSTFLEGASQTLLPYNKSGRLAGYGGNGIRRISEMRDRQVVVFVVAPLSHKREFRSFISQINHDVLMVCKQNPTGHPIHIEGDEALAYPYVDLTSDLETLRGLGLTASFYYQSYPGLEIAMGEKAAQAIMAYTDIKFFAGINDLKRAQHVSDLLSEETIKRQDYSAAAMADKVNVSTREMGKRLMTAVQVLKMKSGQAWLFVRGMHPILFDLAPDGYGSVSPWCDWVAPHPVHGKCLPRNPIFTIHYPNSKMEANNADQAH